MGAANGRRQGLGAKRPGIEVGVGSGEDHRQRLGSKGMCALLRNHGSGALELSWRTSSLSLDRGQGSGSGEGLLARARRAKACAHCAATTDLGVWSLPGETSSSSQGSRSTLGTAKDYRQGRGESGMRALGCNHGSARLNPIPRKNNTPTEPGIEGPALWATAEACEPRPGRLVAPQRGSSG